MTYIYRLIIFYCIFIGVESVAKECVTELPNSMQFKFELKRSISPDDVKTLIYKANQGDSLMQYGLGGLYEHGITVNRNSKLAFQWYTKSANNGLAVAQFQLGLINLFCVDRNVNDAKKWFLKASENRLYPESNFYLAYISAHFGNNKQDKQEGILAIKLMANQKKPLAMLELSHMLRLGKLVEKSEKAAFMLMLELVERDYRPALYHLALYYRDGIGTEKSANTYIKLLTQSAENDVLKAKNELLKYRDVTNGN